MSNNVSDPQILIFADSMNIAGELVDRPTLDDLVRLESKLTKGQLVPFSFSRNTDRDSTMEFNLSGTLFGIVGSEESNQRGTFGYSLLDMTKSSSKLLLGPEYYPEYCTTHDVNLVISIARKYFLLGDLDRSVTWHVSRQGIGRPLEVIPDSEILHAHNESRSLSSLLSSI